MDKMIHIYLLALALLLLILIHFEERFSLKEDENNPGYAYKRLLSIQPRSVFDCEKRIPHNTPGYFSNLVECQQNSYSKVKIKNIS